MSSATDLLKPLRVGIVGAGANTQARHIPGLRAIPGVTIAALCNRTRASGTRVADRFQIPRVTDHWRDLVGMPGLDAIVIGTWPHLHAEVTLAALAAGKHVLTEARMARTLAEAETMLGASRAHPERVAQIVPAPLSLDFDATIRTMIEEGALGQLREITVTQVSAVYADQRTPLSWRQDFELSGVNTLALGICYEMVERWLQVEPVAVMADAAVFTPERTNESGASIRVGVPDSVTVLARYADGMRLVAHLSAVARGEARSEIRLHGSRASLRLDLNRQELWLAPAGTAETAVPIPTHLRRGWRVEEDFVTSIRTGAPVHLTDFGRGVSYMRFTEAVWRAWSDFDRKATPLNPPPAGSSHPDSGRRI